VQGHASERPSFQFGSPIFDKVIIELDKTYYKGGQLIISTQNQQVQNAYIQSVSWNDKEILTNWIYRDLLMEGGELNFVMGPEPNKNWGVQTTPPSMTSTKN
jgi:putative alpha-1,2-mannosidase